MARRAIGTSLRCRRARPSTHLSKGKTGLSLSGRTIWQISCGDTDRNYADICLKWDVILNGPGYAGPWPTCANRLKDDGVPSRKITDIRRFAEEIKDGDIIVLRLGTTDVLGVGIVVGDYLWHAEFSDIDGWDLQHVRRVRWLHKGLSKKFPSYTLKFGDTTQRLDGSSSSIVISWLRSLTFPNWSVHRKLCNLPRGLKKEIDIDEISEYLFDQGVSSNSIEILAREIDELIRIAKWYKKFGNPSESETIAYLVIPLLRALGWTPQKMAVEWNRIDIALFSKLPREDNNLSVVVEVKKKGNSCLSAKSQAISYASGKSKCKRVIVTDGLRYGIYTRDTIGFKLYAYLNLTELKDKYPLYECFGAKEALAVMTPEWK